MVTSGSGIKESFSSKLRKMPRWASFLILFLAIVVTPITILFLDNFITPAQSWFDSSWEYRKPIVITNSGSSKTNYDVLVTLDTATLITDEKIQSDCDDIRFVDSDDTTLLSYWIEGGCNTSDTQIWIRVPSIDVGNKTVYLYYGNGSATSGQTSWGGNFILMYNTTCPSGWTRFSALDSKFPRGSSTYGGTGGSNTHNHGQVSGTSTGPNPTNNVNTSCDLLMAGTSGHNNTKADINNATVRPPYLNVVYCQSPDLTLSSGMVSVFDATVPSGWTRFSALDSKFPRGSSTYGGTGGATSHTHTTTGGYTSGPSNDSCAPGADGAGSAAWGHDHTSLSGSTGSATNTPPYLDVIYGQIDANGMAPSKSISIVSSVPPFGWTRFSALDSKFPRGSSTYGGTGGATSHTHSVTVTLNTYSGGRSPKNTIGGRVLSNSSHNHTYTTTSASGSNLPSYLNTIFAKKNDNSSDSISFALQSEESNAPATPTVVPAQALSTSSIRWNFIDNAGNEEGFRVLDGDGNIKADCVGVDLTYCDETGLSPNTEYTRYIVAYNSNGPSNNSDAVSRYTQVSAPSISISSVGVTSIDLSASGVTNLGTGLTALYFDCVSVSCNSGLNSWVDITNDSSIDLTSNTQYTFRVKARNGDGVETAYSASESVYTYASVPTVSTPSLTSDSITVQVDNVPNLNSGLSGMYVVCECNTESPVPNTWVDSSQAVIGGFVPNSLATITVKVRNGDGVETGLSSPLVVHTGANTPLAPVISDVASSSYVVRLNPDQNSNPSSIEYIVRSGTSEFQYLNPGTGIFSPTPTWADYDTWNLGGGIMVSNQTEGTSIDLSVIARNSDDVETSPSGYNSFYTLLATPTLVSGTATSSSVVRWNLVDNGINETGFKVYDASDTLKVTCTGVDLTFCDESGLNPNSTYTRKVTAYNSNVESAFSGTISKTTLSNIPTLTNITGTEGRVSFGVSMNGNPGGTEIQIRDEVTGKYYNPTSSTLGDAEVWFEYVDTGDDILVNSLESNTRYEFVVRSRNSENVASNFSEIYEVYTLSATPSITSVLGESPTSVRVIINNEGNPTITNFALREVNSGQYVNYSTGVLQLEPMWGTHAQFLGSTGILVTGLSANTQYQFDVKARNEDFIESTFSSSVIGYTYANTPTVASLVANSPTVLVLTLGDGSNPANTELAVRENDSMLYVNSTTGVLQASPSWATFTQWGGVSGFGITGLSPNTLYEFSAVARNTDEVITSFSASESLYTLANVPGSVTSDQVGVNSVNLILDENGNPNNTEYAIYNVTDSSYIDYVTGNASENEVWGIYAQWGGSNGYTLSGLDSGTNYEFVSKAKNSNNVETAFSIGSNISTSLNAPTIGEAERLSETSIRWNFTDNENNELGYRVFDEEGVQVAECVGTSLSSCVEYGLTPNTQYVRKVAAYNANGRGDFSQTVTRYTPAAVPQFVLSEAVSSTSLKLSIDPNGNPVNTQYQIVEVVSGLKVGSINNGGGSLVVGDSWNTFDTFGGEEGVTINNLFANAQYKFEVVARDGEDEVSSPSSQVTLYTLAVTTQAPTVQALGETSLTLVLDNGGNSEITTFSLKDIKNDRYFNFSNGSWVTQPVWGTYLQWGRTNGLTISGLGINTEYEYGVISRNGAEAVSPISQTVTKYTLSNIPSRPTVSQNTGTSFVVRLGENLNPSHTEYLVLDTVSNRYLDPKTNSLVTSPRWGTFSDFGLSRGVSLSGLIPGARYEFIARSRNGNKIESSPSSSYITNTNANIPGVANITTVTLRSLRVRLNRNQNDPSVQYSIQEESQNRYIDFKTGLLTSEPVWGTYSEFGGDLGVIVTGLAPVTDYSFRVSARNSLGVVTGYGARVQFGTNAKIENAPSGVSLKLRNNSNIDPSTDLGGQRGVQVVRAFRGGKIVADIPVDFNQNRDWSSAVITTEGGRVAVKLPETSGLTGTYTMFVPKEDTNRFRLCMKAEDVSQVNSECAGSVVFAGPYPQTIVVDELSITVSTTVIDGISYWVVSGLTGTGGLGERIDTGGEVIKEPLEGEGDNDSDVTPPAVVKPIINIPNESLSKVVNSVITTVTQTTPQQAIDGVRVAIDNSPVGALPQPQLTVVSTTATAATVTVGLAAVGGGFSSIPYVFTQLALSLLSFLGFRKKGKPYGYVYDSVTKEPVSRAIVRIYDEHDKLVWTDVTDVYGSFNVELSKGRYKILVKKAGYTYPTSIIKGVVDYPIEPVYKGELLKFSKKGDIRVHVPIDPDRISGVKALLISAKSSVNFLAKFLHIIIFIGGVVLGSYTIYKFPSITNAIVLIFYIPAFVLLYNSLFGQDSKYGVVTNEEGKPVSNVEVALKEMKFDRFVTKRITDEKGRYRFVIYPGDYELVIISKEYRAKKFEGGSNIVNVSQKGDKIIARDIVLKNNRV